MTPLNGRIALVTGASRGLGKGIAESLGEQGARVVVNCARSSDAAKRVVAGITASGGTAVAEQADVLDAEAVRNMLQRVRKKWGNVEILVNNATGPQPMKPLEDYSWKDFQDQLEFFVKAPVLLMKEILPAMKTARWGRVIHIGSEVVHLGNTNFSAYVTAKAAMVGLTRSWASEFGPHGITVNCVEPGWIPVERHAEIASEDTAAYQSRVPLGRQGIPRDIGEAVAFLAGESANFITGQCLAVNGGNTY